MNPIPSGLATALALAFAVPALSAAESAAPPYDSAFTGYKPWRDVTPGDWRAANRAVAQAPGHEGHGAAPAAGGHDQGGPPAGPGAHAMPMPHDHAMHHGHGMPHGQGMPQGQTMHQGHPMQEGHTHEGHSMHEGQSGMHHGAHPMPGRPPAAGTPR